MATASCKLGLLFLYEVLEDHSVDKEPKSSRSGGTGVVSTESVFVGRDTNLAFGVVRSLHLVCDLKVTLSGDSFNAENMDDLATGSLPA